ncbi:pentapeptide repeat-containing protein [Aquimarina megaterium]|uniref:pentapeptide repeat-containing protein n=1 Tax=Aquimarina megaterium TaxID=1443666 RepID=UPI00047207A1|nr:pentapeptide repeat-containing protein [Aquimarina megaterium]
MSHPIIDKTFENKDFSNQKLPSKEYDNCTFVNCNFSKTDMSVVTFLECRFDTCNFNTIMMKETSFQEVVFDACKMLGLDFSTCNDFLFEVEFNHCNLDYVSFYGFSMKNTTFNDCSLKEADFTDADLTGSILSNCNLSGAIFERTIAEKVDFRTAKNFIIDPEINKLKKAKFSTSGLIGLLTKYDLTIE